VDAFFGHFGLTQLGWVDRSASLDI
jgi:hypothetical protein